MSDCVTIEYMWQFVQSKNRHLVTLDGCDDDSRKISVVQFLDEKYKITLKYRRLPTPEWNHI